MMPTVIPLVKGVKNKKMKKIPSTSNKSSIHNDISEFKKAVSLLFLQPCSHWSSPKALVPMYQWSVRNNIQSVESISLKLQSDWVGPSPVVHHLLEGKDLYMQENQIASIHPKPRRSVNQSERWSTSVTFESLQCTCVVFAESHWRQKGVMAPRHIAFIFWHQSTVCPFQTWRPFIIRPHTLAITCF